MNKLYKIRRKSDGKFWNTGSASWARSGSQWKSKSGFKWLFTNRGSPGFTRMRGEAIGNVEVVEYEVSETFTTFEIDVPDDAVNYSSAHKVRIQPTNIVPQVPQPKDVEDLSNI